MMVQNVVLMKELLQIGDYRKPLAAAVRLTSRVEIMLRQRNM